VLKFYNYYISPDKSLARKLKSILGFTPKRLNLFKLAFYHKSMKNVSDGIDHYNNERLEYLGDALLSTIVADYLFKKYPNSDEGFLTKMRSKIVKRKSLNTLAEKMGLDLILSSYSQGKLSNAMMGNALEALVGAIYLEYGYKFTKKYVVKKILREYIDIHELETFDDNFKSRLLEYCQKHGHNVDFRLINKYKHDKRDRFKVAIVLNGNEVAYGDDFNKKSAEQAASKLALNGLTPLNA
jgi:ribonuclease-3